MELFDTHFVYFGPILPVSGMKLLLISGYYVQVIKSQPVYTIGNNISVFTVSICLPHVAVSSKREQIKARLVDGTIEK